MTVQHYVQDASTGETVLEAAPIVVLSEAQRRESMIAATNAKVASVLASGFTVPVEVSSALGGKLLQTRDADDRINWLVSQASYSTAVATGAGADIGAEFCTSDNLVVIVSYQEGLAVLLAMAQWGAAAMRQSWALKDAIAVAETHAALDAIDIDEGWPSGT